MFKQVCKKISKPEKDFFAAHLNAKCESYVSFNPDPNAFALDLSTQIFNDIKGYAFPPSSLTGRILAKVKRDEASIIVTTSC